MNPDEAMPELIPPMLAAAGPVPAGPGWAFEFKYDGVRAVSYVDRDGVRALTRNGNDVTTTYPELAELRELLAGRRAVLDGEIVALEDGSRPSFARLAARLHVATPSAALLATVPVVYYVFDVLWIDGHSTLEQPYERRRRLLADLRLGDATVRTPPHFAGVDGHAVLRTAELGGLEGIVAKRLDGAYRPGRRSGALWTKVPLIRTQEVLIVGWKAGEGRRAGAIGSLLLGVLDAAGALRFAGHVGTGFTGATLRRLGELLAPLRRATPPLPDVPREHARHAQWVEPALIGEVAFRNWTPDGRLRHASWRGLRPDRSPAEARRDPSPPVEPAPVVKGVMGTPDGSWRVEVVSRRGVESFRVVHRENVVEGLDLPAVERLLVAQGIDMRTLAQYPAA